MTDSYNTHNKLELALTDAGMLFLFLCLSRLLLLILGEDNMMIWFYDATIGFGLDCKCKRPKHLICVNVSDMNNSVR